MSEKNNDIKFNFINKLSIGTAQFGLDYGIANKYGKISKSEVERILNFAKDKGILKIDTAQAYGNSEIVLGRVINRDHSKKFSITSKISPQNIKRIEESLDESLANLRVEKLDSILYHDFKSWKENQESINIIQQLRSRCLISNVGFSLYYPEELEYLLNKKVQFNVVQIPYNIFDRRFEKYFNILKDKNIFIQIRSVFLQGLFFLNPDELPLWFTPVKLKLKLLHDISRKNNLASKDIHLSFVNKNEFIDTIIMGIDSLENLKDNISIDFGKTDKILNQINIDDLQENNENILIPSKWKI